MPSQMAHHSVSRQACKPGSQKSLFSPSLPRSLSHTPWAWLRKEPLGFRNPVTSPPSPEVIVRRWIVGDPRPRAPAAPHLSASDCAHRTSRSGRLPEFGEFLHALWSLGAQFRVFLANSGSHISGDVARHVV